MRLRCLLLPGLFLLACHAQEPATPTADAAVTDWRAEVERACTSPRYGLRLGAARKVAAAGDAAVPAIRAFADQHGSNAIPQALVDAIADQAATSGAATRALLASWANDQAFYWRPHALRGIAEARDPAHLPLCARLLADPAWLVRVYAAAAHFVPGQPLAGGPALDGLGDPDPRAQVKLAAWLLGNGETAGVPLLVQALGDARTFLGDPWGQRRAQEAFAALKRWLGSDFGYRSEVDLETNDEALARLQTALQERHGIAVERPLPIEDLGHRYVGGIEVLSCRHGDLFLRWTAGGNVVVGLDERRSLALRPAAWTALDATRTGLQLDPAVGVVICDSMRLRWSAPDLHSRIAPASLPEAAVAWLKQFAAAIEEAGDAALAEGLRTRLAQFASR